GLKPVRQDRKIVGWEPTDTQPTLYRHASHSLRPEYASRFCFATFDPASSAAYANLLQRDVAALPVPRSRAPIDRTRTNKAAVTVAFLGEQRPDKGFQHVPAIVRLLLKKHRSIRV